MNFQPETLERLRLLQEKYAVMGQDLNAYLDGLLFADYLTYWDYIHLDTLLSIQTPRTPIPDEMIFVVYHQITELYFKLSLHAIEQVAYASQLKLEDFKEQVRRVNTYLAHLIGSFGIMVEGMNREQFLRFRMSLLPASGFQSVQYRMIEIASTDCNLLLQGSQREAFAESRDWVAMYEQLYWKSGSTELASGKKTLTLQQFEQKYRAPLLRMAEEYADRNLRQCFLRLTDLEKEDAELREQLRELDLNANVRWGLMHYRSAVRYLDRKPREIAATGGTNWQQYLPPKNQRVVFFPELWSEQELEDWGKTFGV